MSRQRVLLLLLALSLGFWASTRFRDGDFGFLKRFLPSPFLKLGEEDAVAEVLELPREVEEAIRTVDERYEAILALLVDVYRSREPVEVPPVAKHPLAVEGAEKTYGAKEVATSSADLEEVPPPSLEVRGIASGSSGPVLLAVVEGKLRPLRVGDSVGVWKVFSISPQKVVLVAQDKHRHEVAVGDIMRERALSSRPAARGKEEKEEPLALSVQEAMRKRGEMMRRRFEEENLPPPPPTGDALRGL